MTNIMSVELSMDGSCLSNGMENATAGWSVVIKGDINHNLIGKLPGKRQTNNRAELYALLKALEWVQDNPTVKASIQSDSKIAIDGLLGDSQRKANRDIWSQIEDITPIVSNRIFKVEHIDRELNKEADELERKAANALIILDN